MRLLCIDTKAFDLCKLQTSTRRQCVQCACVHVWATLTTKFQSISTNPSLFNGFPDSCMHCLESAGVVHLPHAITHGLVMSQRQYPINDLKQSELHNIVLPLSDMKLSSLCLAVVSDISSQ